MSFKLTTLCQKDSFGNPLFNLADADEHKAKLDQRLGIIARTLDHIDEAAGDPDSTSTTPSPSEMRRNVQDALMELSVLYTTQQALMNIQVVSAQMRDRFGGFAIIQYIESLICKAQYLLIKIH